MLIQKTQGMDTHQELELYKHLWIPASSLASSRISQATLLENTAHQCSLIKSDNKTRSGFQEKHGKYQMVNLHIDSNVNTEYKIKTICQLVQNVRKMSACSSNSSHHTLWAEQSAGIVSSTANPPSTNKAQWPKWQTSGWDKQLCLIMQRTISISHADVFSFCETVETVEIWDFPQPHLRMSSSLISYKYSSSGFEGPEGGDRDFSTGSDVTSYIGDSRHGQADNRIGVQQMTSLWGC